MKAQCTGWSLGGGEDGFLECFDLRQKTPVGRINAVGLGNEDLVMDCKDILHRFVKLFGMGFPTWFSTLFQ